MERILFLILFITGCNGAVHRINDTEYIRMPPLFKLDDYDSCLLRHDGTYCILRLDLASDSPNDLINLIHKYSEPYTTRFNHTYLERGVCVPTACKSFFTHEAANVIEDAKLHSILETCLNESIWKDYGIQSKLTAVYYCDKHNQAMEYDFYDWMVVVMVIAVIILNIAGTKYDLRNANNVKEVTEGIGESYLHCFSLIRNWKWLTIVESQEKRIEQLKGLHCLKFMLTLFIVMAHTMFINTTFIDNPQDIEKAYDTFYYHILHGGIMLVQAFFVLSSFTLVYYSLIINENVEIKWHMYPWIVLQRFFRLTPVYLVLLAFTATWLRHLGTGPLWNLSITGSSTADCRQHWWKHLLYINNYDYEDNCALHTWYLAADFQLFLLGVAIFILAKRLNKSLVMLSLLLLGTILPALQVWLNDLDGVVIMRPEFFRTYINDTLRLLHIRTHNNLSGYVIGMWTAYLVYDLQKKKVKFLNNAILRNLCWLVLPVTLCLFASSSVFYSSTERASMFLRMASASLYRVVMAGITAFTVIALVFKFNEKISTIFEWSGWVVPSKLSYCVYLIHTTFIQIHLGVRTQLFHRSTYNSLVLTLGMTVLSLFAALPLYLMVEAPINRLVKLQVSKKVKLASDKAK